MSGKRPLGKFVFSAPGKDAVECAVLWPNENARGEYYSLQVHTERKTGEYPRMPFKRALELIEEEGPDGKKKGYLNFWPSGPKGTRLVLELGGSDVGSDDYEDI